MSFRILALSGGGIRGVFQAIYLRELFKKIGANAADHFDLIAGTSTGAIVGGCAAFGVDMSSVADLFETKGPAIFARRWLAGFRRGPRYSTEPLRATLEKYLAGRRLGEAAVPLLLPTALLDQFGHHIFSSLATPDVNVIDAILASSAAPTYFPPLKPAGQSRTFVDGGVWANNPAIAAINHAIYVENFAPEDVRIVLLGNGYFPSGLKPSEFLRARPVSKTGIKGLFDLMFAAQETAAEHYARQVLSPEHVLKVNTQLASLISLDDVKEALEILPARAEHLANETHTQIRIFLANTSQPHRALRQVAAELGNQLRSSITNAPWVEEEREHVTLTEPGTDDRAILNPDLEGIFRCDILTERRGNVCREEARILFCLEGFNPPPIETPDFEYVLGRGLLAQAAHVAFRDGVNIENLAHYIHVESVTFSDQHTEIIYDQLPLEHGPGYFLFKFHCPGKFTDFDRYQCLKLRIKTYASKGQGWWTYRTDNTITRLLKVEFTSPFEVTGIQHLRAKRVDAEPVENQRIDGAYYSSFTVNGPVAVNATVDWIFGGQ